MNWVARTAAALIAVQLVVRAVLAFRGYFYWDDLILTGRAGTQGLLSPAYLFDDHDGHVMPGAFLVAGGITRLAPLNWIGPAISLVVLQLLASLALLRALHVILGWRPVLLLPLTFALFTPLSVPAFAWWAAALNSLPMLAALAWVCADAVLLVRTGNQRYAVTGLLVYFGGLLFFEKAAVIPFVAFTIAALYAHVTSSGSVATVWRRGVRLWVSALAVTAAWIAVYLVVVDQKRWSFDVAMTWDLLSRSVTHGIVPGLVGGPWDWQRWAPASPWATPPVAVMVLGWVALAVVVAISFIRKQRIGPVWLVAVGYAVACQIPIYLMRSSRFTALELAQTLRYLPDLVVVLALLLAVGLCAPNREGIDVVGCVAGADGGNAVRHSRFRCEQPVLDRDVPDHLAREPGAAVSAERQGGAGRGERRLECTTSRSGGRSVGVAAGGRAGESGQPHVRAAARPAGVRRRNNRFAHAGRERSRRRREGHLGAVDRSRARAEVRLSGAAGLPGVDAAGWPAAAGGLDSGDQLPRQQRRLDDDVAVGGHGDEGAGAPRAQPCLRATAGGR